VPAHRHELVARALLSLERDPKAVDLIGRWQLTADQFSYPAAESLAWAAMAYLEETVGRQAVLMLGSRFLTRPVGSTALVSLLESATRLRAEVESITGMTADEFAEGWQQWLQDQRNEEPVQRLMAAVPAVRGVLTTTIDSAGVRAIEGSYEVSANYSGRSSDFDALEGMCIMKHDYIGPFDTEFNVMDDNEDVAPCEVGVPLHSIRSAYAAGDRVIVALDFEGPDFHQPIRLHAQRLYIP